MRTYARINSCLAPLRGAGIVVGDIRCLTWRFCIVISFCTDTLLLRSVPINIGVVVDISCQLLRKKLKYYIRLDFISEVLDIKDSDFYMKVSFKTQGFNALTVSKCDWV